MTVVTIVSNQAHGYLRTRKEGCCPGEGGNPILSRSLGGQARTLIAGDAWLTLVAAAVLGGGEAARLCPVMAQ